MSIPNSKGALRANPLSGKINLLSNERGAHYDMVSDSFELNPVDFQYDPEKIKVTKELKYEEKNLIQLAQPLISFSGGETQSASFTIYFDAHRDTNRGHVTKDLDAIRDLAVPRDNGKRVSNPPSWQDVSPYGGTSSSLGGVPPIVDIALGGRAWSGLISKIDVEELKHGTTPATKSSNLCTRAKVDLDFLVLEEMKLYVNP